MTKWKFQKAKDAKSDETNYVGYISDFRTIQNTIYKEFYVPEIYLKEGKIDDIPPPKNS